MGSFTFKWTQPANEVYVTGTFDNWGQSARLEKVGDSFEKTVELPDAAEKIYYKFVVDRNWLTDLAAPLEKDKEGNENNVLTREQIVKAALPTVAIMSGVTPESTTAKLAAAAPLEVKKAAEVKEEAEKVVEEKKPELSEKSSAAEEKVEESNAVPVETPGDLPSTSANELEKPVGISPMPAAENGLNPIKLAPGEPIPESIATENTNQYVKLDKESYEKADALPGDGAAASMSIPPVSENMIPESSLPIAGANDVHIATVTPVATTVALAAGAPIETKKEEIQEKAGVEPEASAVSEEVEEKAATTGKGADEKEGETTASGAATEAPEPLKEAVVAESAEKTQEEVSPEVPAEVKESVADTKASPEAAANTEAVADKKVVETELPKEVEETVPAELKTEPESAAEPSKAEEKKAEEPAKATETVQIPTNGEAPAKSAAGQSTAVSTSETPETTQAKKKKNRLSAIFSKVKSKISSKH